MLAVVVEVLMASLLVLVALVVAVLVDGAIV
jgi:hypothetical protein